MSTVLLRLTILLLLGPQRPDEKGAFISAKTGLHNRLTKQLQVPIIVSVPHF